MSSYPHPIIAREGWPFVAIALVVAIGVTIAGWAAVAIVAWLATLFILQFFRDPKRNVSQQPNAVLSPADGTVVKVGQARDPCLNRDALLISVFMNVFNVHSRGRRQGIRDRDDRRRAIASRVSTRPIVVQRITESGYG